MVSLWGSKKQETSDVAAADASHDGEVDDQSQATPHEYGRSDVDERTRLLPSNRAPRRSDGYLDPDDPAVSPYNLWTVRFIRYLTVVFALVSFIWWVLLFVSIFVSPPGMNSRGSGFTDFSFTTLTLGNLLVALLFFSEPSKAMRVSTGVLALLLVVDMIIIVSITRIRGEEGWVGITSVVWAALIAMWCVVTDRVVAWGKREEEERLTGRPETRRTLKEWLAVLVATTILIIYIIIAVLMTATLTLRATDAGLKPDGERYAVDGGKYKIHLSCVGNTTETHGIRSPTILLESGEVPLEGDFESWVYRAWENGVISRYCYWDRPGYGWSDDAPSPHSAGMSADALSEALAIAGEQGPWISVSAGYGSVVARIFAARRRHEVVGMLLVDPLHEDLLYRAASASQGFKLWGYGIISPLGIQRLIGALSGRTKEDRVYGRSVWQTGKFLKAKLQENLVADSLSKSEVSSARLIQSAQTPLVVVSSGIEVNRDSQWEKKQEDLTKLTDQLLHWDVVNKAPHRVWEKPEGRRILERRLSDLIKAAVKPA